MTTPIGTPYAIPATAQAVMYHQAAAQAPMVIPLAGRTQYVPALGGVAVPVAAVATSGLATGTAIPVPAAAAGGVAAVGGAGVTLAGGCGPPPEITGIGRTAGETALEQCQFAYANGLFEPQDIKPADDDPSRYYPVREVDGNWTQRNRFTIDNLGDCRWYVTNEGYFYAVRMPN